MKKIMFNDKYGLTQAVLEGRKTQTRRIVKTPENATGCEIITIQRQHREYVSCERLLSIHTESHIGVTVGIPYQVEDEIAVAQSYDECFKSPNYKIENDGSLFVQPISEAGYTNKMFVRADLMPHRIKITKVRVERLQNISDEDCLKEGIEFARGCYYTNYNKETNSRIWLGHTPKEAFAALIDKTCGRGTWDSNPYVFVYDFELIK